MNFSTARLRTLIAGTCLLLGAPLMAQNGSAAAIVGGSLGISLDPNLAPLLQGVGITSTAYVEPASFNGALRFAWVGGSADMASGNGEIQTEGTLLFTEGRTKLRLEHLTFDTNSAINAVTADIYIGTIFQGRQPVFTIMTPNPLGAPLAVGISNPSNIQTTLTPGFITLFDNTFNNPILAGYKGISVMDLYMRVNQLNNEGCTAKFCVERSTANFF
jgi:hypothetical protein